MVDKGVFILGLHVDEINKMSSLEAFLKAIQICENHYKQEGRVDFLNSVEFKNLIQSAESKGAISELKIIIKRNSNFKYSRLDMIEFCEKRLVKLEKKGVN